MEPLVNPKVKRQQSQTLDERPKKVVSATSPVGRKPPSFGSASVSETAGGPGLTSSGKKSSSSEAKNTKQVRPRAQ